MVALAKKENGGRLLPWLDTWLRIGEAFRHQPGRLEDSNEAARLIREEKIHRQREARRKREITKDIVFGEYNMDGGKEEVLRDLFGNESEVLNPSSDYGEFWELTAEEFERRREKKNKEGKDSQGEMEKTRSTELRWNNGITLPVR